MRSSTTRRAQRVAARRWTRRALLAAGLASGLVTAAAAGSDVRPVDSPSRPKTALVLSGGGARGAAHIGVLSVLEELHVPVDVIVGTSMGSIVGGLYASGRSPAAIEAELRAVQWTELFNDRPERKDVSFRRKQLDELALFQVEFGITSKGLRLPAGLIAGQKLNFQLRRLTLHTTAVADFDALPIPYRAVAADLATGDPVVLKDGDLATAMRASMSIPGVFTPVVVDGRTLVDGGIARNLPVDVARALGAERIIAVQLRNYGEIRVGVEKGSVDRERFPETAAGADEVDLGSARFEARLDQLDNLYFPRSGQLGNVTLLASRTELGATDDYDLMSLFYLHAGSFGRNTLLGTAQYSSALGSELPSYTQLSLGGFLDLSGLEPGELQGSYLGYVSLIYYYEVMRLPRLFGGGVYAGASLEAGNVWDRSSAMDLGDLRLSGMLLGGADTLLGPVYLGYGRAEGGASSWYLFLGSPFSRRFR